MRSNVLPTLSITRDLPVEAEIVPDRVLPALVRCPVVRVVLGDVGVNTREGELLVAGVGDGLHDQLGVRERRLGLILGTTEH